MKIFSCILLLVFALVNLNAQNFATNDGLAVTLTGGLTATIQNGGYTNQTNGANLGTIDNAGTITLTGNWTNNAANTVFSTNNGTVQFIGTAAQVIGGSNSTGFYNLTINNTSATGITLAAPATAGGTLTLNDGLLYADNTNFLTLTAGSSVGAVSDSSFMSGPVAKTGNTDFTFPVGKDAAYRPVAVTSLSGSETFTAEYFHSDPNLVPYDVTSKDASLDHISRCEYWTVNRTGTQNAFVTLSWDAYSCGVDNLATLAVARWDGVVWRDHGNGGTTGAPDPGTGTVVTAAIVSSFSPFTLASTDGGNLLPIKLLSFTGQCNNQDIILSWSTTTEINHDFFTLERSANGINWEIAGKVKGVGNSSTVRNYSFTDIEPYNKTSHYRLKQTDFDGKYTYSKIITVENCENNLPGFIIFPNPNSGKFLLEFIAPDLSLHMPIIIHNSTGQIIYKSVIKNSQSEIDLSQNPSGVYYLLVQTEQGTKRQKIIVDK